MTNRSSGSGWWRRRRAIIAGLAMIVGFYLVAIFADFLAPYPAAAQSRREPHAPAALIGRCPPDAGGADFSWRPCVFRQILVDPLARRYVADARARPAPLVFFPRGYSYKLFGLIPFDRHLFGVAAPADARETPRVNLLGTDQLGRDRFSRLVVASRFSLLAGPAGTLLASVLGIVIGCAAGYAGRFIDAALMRVADVLLALPTLVIILAARAAFPLELPPARAAFLLVSIFTLLGWAEMARLTRNLVVALREREFVLAAESLGLARARILFRHILPNAARPLIVQASLLLPAFLLAETALSFLGVGLQEPEPSWGNMLTEATDLTLLRRHAFAVLSPAVAILLVTLGAHLVAEALRRRGARDAT